MRYRLVWLIAAVIVLWGCQDSGQPDSSQIDKPQVVRRKITADTSADLNSQKKEASSEASPSDGKASGKMEPASDDSASGDPAAALLGSEDATEVYQYQGKLNPFIPLIKEKKRKSVPPGPIVSAKLQPKKRIPQTPLEKVDLSQLTLTAVFRNQKGNRAMVEESTGKGYIVKKGAYIGLDGGRITKILRDRILITEASEDVMGKPVTVKRELKLRQFTGE